MLMAKLVQMEGWVRHAMLGTDSQVALKAIKRNQRCLGPTLL